MRRLNWAAAVCIWTALAAGAEPPKIVAYVPNWIDLKKFAPTIPYQKLTHINIAFENPVNDDGEMSFSQNNAELIQHAQRRQVKVLLSIGGGSASGNKTLLKRYALLMGPQRREGFAAKLAAVVEKQGLDGLDVDIEGPTIDANYGAFITELAKALRPRGKLLTAALSRGYGGDKVADGTLGEFDFVNIMAYDGAGPWNPKAAGQHSSMEFARSNVEYWLKRGLARDKAVLGVPFYGYGFGESFRNRDYPYREIVDKFPGASQADQVGNTIWYNGVPTILEKSRFAKERGLGGVMIWSLDLDAAGEASLLEAIHQGLTGGAAK